MRGTLRNTLGLTVFSILSDLAGAWPAQDIDKVIPEDFVELVQTCQAAGLSNDEMRAIFESCGVLCFEAHGDSGADSPACSIRAICELRAFIPLLEGDTCFALPASPTCWWRQEPAGSPKYFFVDGSTCFGVYPLQTPYCFSLATDMASHLIGSSNPGLLVSCGFSAEFIPPTTQIPLTCKAISSVVGTHGGCISTGSISASFRDAFPVFSLSSGARITPGPFVPASLNVEYVAIAPNIVQVTLTGNHRGWPSYDLVIGFGGEQFNIRCDTPADHWATDSNIMSVMPFNHTVIITNVDACFPEQCQ